jgi:acyl carrier protein
VRATDQWPPFIEDLARLAEVPADEIDRQTRLTQDLDLDSLALVELVVKLDHEHGVNTARRLQADGWQEITAGELFDRVFGSSAPD